MDDMERFSVPVYSDVEAVKKYGEVLCEGLLLPVSVSLVLDDPWGFALNYFSELKRPVFIVTACKSPYYLHDLLDLEPDGLEISTGPLMSLTQQLVSIAAGERFYKGPPLKKNPLSPREREVFRMVAYGAANDQIASVLGVSSRTAANYVSNVRDKLGRRNIAELVLLYFGLLSSFRKE